MNAGVIFRYRIPNCTKEILHGLAKRFLDKIEISKRFVYVFCGHKTNSFKKPYSHPIVFYWVTNVHGPSPQANSMQISCMQYDNCNSK